MRSPEPAPERASHDLDCAAALVTDEPVVRNASPSIGLIDGYIEPKIGICVPKVGAASGLSKGVITQVLDSAVFFRTSDEFPSGYVISAPGDSGALWIGQATHKAVSINRGFKGSRTATSTVVGAALRMLKLEFLYGKGAHPHARPQYPC